MSSGIPCPDCGSHKSRIIDTRATRGVHVRRRHVCKCGHRYSTREMLWPPVISGADVSEAIGQAVIKALGGSR